MSKRASVLVVDDHPVNRKITKKSLEVCGFEAQSSSSGHEALAQVAKNDFAAILMDRHMPDLDGLQTTRLLIEKWGKDTPPIIGLSAGSAKDEAECRAAGMVDFLPKPATPETLKRCLQVWLARPAANDLVDQPVGDALAPRAAPSLTATDHARVFDQEEALLMVGGDTELLLQVVLTYLSVADDYEERLRSAVLAEEPKATGEAAHALKSAARSLSAHELAELTDLMERDAASMTPQDRTQLLERIEQAALTLRHRLKSLASG